MSSKSYDTMNISLLLNKCQTSTSQLASVVRFTIRTFLSNNMVLDARSGLTVIAKDRDLHRKIVTFYLKFQLNYQFRKNDICTHI